MATDAMSQIATARIYKNFIDGEWVEARTGETFENLNPADTRDVVGIFQKSGPEDVHEAVAAALQAFQRWRLVPAPRRAELLYTAAQMLVEHKERFAHDMTREMGKILKETRGDVQEAIDTGFYMAGEGRRLFGITTPSELPNKFAMAVREPLGVCAMITPWNFPMAIPSWKLFPALLAGNTCVIKPARGYTALDVQPSGDTGGGRTAARRGERHSRIRPRGRAPAAGTSGGVRRLVHRLHRGRPNCGCRLCAQLETVLA